MEASLEPGDDGLRNKEAPAWAGDSGDKTDFVRSFIWPLARKS